MFLSGITHISKSPDHTQSGRSPLQYPMTITITPQELGTILAALRHWQTEISDGDYPGDLWDIAADGGAMVPLDAEDIDLLCESLNCGPEEPEPVAVEKAPVKPDDRQLVREAVRILDLIHIPCPINPLHQSAATDGDAPAEPLR